MKDPAFLFYPDNFMSGTMFFTDEQVGKYIRLLCAQHLTGHLSQNHMIFICKSNDEDILKKFIQDEDGNYYNERLEQEINKRIAYSKSRSANKLGKKKNLKNPKIISNSYEDHMGNGNGNINTSLNTIIYGEFSNLITEWLKYKKERSETYKSKSSIDKFCHSLQVLSGNNLTTARQIIDQSMSNNWAGIFALKNIIAHPATSYKTENQYADRF